MQPANEFRKAVLKERRAAILKVMPANDLESLFRQAGFERHTRLKTAPEMRLIALSQWDELEALIFNWLEGAKT